MKTHIIKLTNKNNKKLQEIKKENDLKNVDNTLNFILEKYELDKNKFVKPKKMTERGLNRQKHTI